MTKNTRLIAGNRRRPLPSLRAGVAMVALFASTTTTDTTSCNVADAFALPKLRTRTPHQSIISTATRSSKAPLEFAQCSEEEKRSSTAASTKAAPGDDDLSSDTTKKVEQERNGKETRVNGTDKSPPPGSPLSMLCEDVNEEDPFELHLGRALDTLKSDYPKMLTKQPEFSIFDKDLEVIDPSGVKLHGLKNYKGAFTLMHAIVKFFYCTDRSGLTFRMCYDKARRNIRVSWNAEVVPKAIFGGVRTTLHVDGISVYEISRKTGMITQHRIESLVINDKPITPSEGVFAMLRNEHDESVPVFNSQSFEFRLAQHSPLFTGAFDFSDEKLSPTALLAASDDNSEGPPREAYPGLDWDAYDKKNASRKKFGLGPMTPEEFMETEAEIQQLASQQQQRAASASAAAATEVANKSKNRGENFLGKLFGNIGPEACESNFDCIRPEVCCDFGFKKICCSSGSMVGNRAFDAPLVPVPADIYPDDQGPLRPGRGRF